MKKLLLPLLLSGASVLAQDASAKQSEDCVRDPIEEYIRAQEALKNGTPEYKENMKEIDEYYKDQHKKLVKKMTSCEAGNESACRAIRVYLKHSVNALHMCNPGSRLYPSQEMDNLCTRIAALMINFDLITRIENA